MDTPWCYSRAVNECHKHEGRVLRGKPIWGSWGGAIIPINQVSASLADIIKDFEWHGMVV